MVKRSRRRKATESIVSRKRHQKRASEQGGGDLNKGKVEGQRKQDKSSKLSPSLDGHLVKVLIR